MSALVSVVILSYQNSDETLECLSSLEKQSYPHFEVVLVDNASRPKDLDRIKRYCEHSNLDLKLISLDTNAGCAGGRNEGAKNATGDYIAFLDSDTQVEDHWLSELVKPFLLDSSQTIGATTSTVRNYFQRDVVEYGGLSRLNVFGQAKAENAMQVSTETRAVAGASFMLPRSAIDELGELFSPVYFFWWEDLDVSWRLHTLGHRLVYVPTSTVFHRVTSRGTRLGPETVPLATRNKYLTFYRNLPCIKFSLLLPLLLGFDLAAGTGSMLLTRDRRFLTAKLRGITHFLRIAGQVEHPGGGSLSYLDRRLYLDKLG